MRQIDAVCESRHRFEADEVLAGRRVDDRDPIFRAEGDLDSLAGALDIEQGSSVRLAFEAGESVVEMVIAEGHTVPEIDCGGSTGRNQTAVRFDVQTNGNMCYGLGNWNIG